MEIILHYTHGADLILWGLKIGLSWLYSERAMMMKEGLISEFEDGGREEQAKEAGSLWKLEKA